MAQKQKKSKVPDKSILYRLTLLASVAQPLTTIPQVLKVSSTHDVSGLSLLTWVGYTLFGLVFLAYGLKYNLKPIIIAQVIWFILQMSIVIGILIYG